MVTTEKAWVRLSVCYVRFAEGSGVSRVFCLCFQAYTQAGAEDGIKFMQEMIELAKQRNEDSGTLHETLYEV